MQTLVDRDRLVFDSPELGHVLYLPGLPGGGSSIYDRSPYGNTGTITGATWVRLPSGLWCLSFDGSDFVSIPVKTEITSLALGTIVIWVYQESIADDDEAIIGITDAGDASSLLGFDLNTVGADKRLRVLSRNDGVYSVLAAGSTDVIENTWYQIVFQQTGKGYEAYVNANQETLSLIVGAVANTDWISYVQDVDTIRIGARVRSGGTVYFGPGKLALPRFANRPFSALEVQNLYNREKHLLGAW